MIDNWMCCYWNQMQDLGSSNRITFFTNGITNVINCYWNRTQVPGSSNRITTTVNWMKYYWNRIQVPGSSNRITTTVNGINCYWNRIQVPSSSNRITTTVNGINCYWSRIQVPGSSNRITTTPIPSVDQSVFKNTGLSLSYLARTSEEAMFFLHLSNRQMIEGFQSAVGIVFRWWRRWNFRSGFRWISNHGRNQHRRYIVQWRIGEEFRDREGSILSVNRTLIAPGSFPARWDHTLNTRHVDWKTCIY